MKIKLRKDYQNLFEAFNTKKKVTLNDLDKAFNKVKNYIDKASDEEVQQKLNQTKQFGGLNNSLNNIGTSKNLDISSTIIKYKDEKGNDKEVDVSKLNELVQTAQKSLSKDPGLKVIAKYYDDPIIWSLDIDTACTDGISIAFNPVFCYENLILKAKEKALDAVQKTIQKDPER